MRTLYRIPGLTGLLLVILSGSTVTRSMGQGSGPFFYYRAAEICNNGIDDDGDGFTDCEDTDCMQFSNGGFEEVPVAPYPGSSITFPPYPNAIGGWSAVNIDGEVFYAGPNKPAVEGVKYASLLQNAGANQRIPWTENSWNGGGYDRFAYIADVTPGQQYEFSFYHAADNRYNYLGNQTLVQVQSMETGFYYDTLLATPGFFDWQRVDVSVGLDAETQRIAILFSSFGPTNSSVVVDAVNFCLAGEGGGPALVAHDDSASLPMGGSTVVPVLDNDEFVPETDRSVEIVQPPAHGNAWAMEDGTVFYQGNAGYVCTDSFTYRVCDTGGAAAVCDDAVVRLVLTGTPPVAVNDTAYGLAGTAVTIPVTANDHDADNDLVPASLQLAAGGEASHGTVTWTTGGQAVYEPGPGFTGTDHFTYSISDNSLPAGLSATARVTVFIEAGPPVMTTDTFHVMLWEDGSLALCPGDYFETQPQVSVLSVCGGPAHGQLAGASGNCLEYFPDPDFSGSDFLCLIACDGESCDTSYFQLLVLPVNDGPDARDDEAVTRENRAVAIDVLANDSDPDGVLSITGVSVTDGPANGLVDKSGDRLVYTPAPGFHGADAFTYRYCDSGSPSMCDLATVTIRVAALPDTVQVYLQEDEAMDLCAADFFDVPADGQGWVCLEAGSSYEALNTLCLEYRPVEDYSGGDTLWQVICANDGFCDTLVYVLDIMPVNDAPDVVDDYAVTSSETAVSVAVILNDSDPADGSEMDASSVTVTDGPVNGTTYVQSDGTVTYAPDPGFSGTDSFTYQVCGLGWPAPAECGYATVFVTVNGPEAGEAITCFIPEAFSPNGDGLYDRFEISCLEHYPDMEVVIYDRAGREVFESGRGYANDWDGGELSSGTYFWFIRFHKPGTTDRAGHVLIWR